LEVRLDPDPRRRTTLEEGVPEAPAPHDAYRRVLRRLIGSRRVAVRAPLEVLDPVPVRAPLGDVPGHVEATRRRCPRRERPDLRRLLLLVRAGVRVVQPDRVP